MFVNWSVCSLETLPSNYGSGPLMVFVFNWYKLSYIEVMVIGDLHTCLIYPGKSGLNY